jgi:DNA-binding response OmpR family regulator
MKAVRQQTVAVVDDSPLTLEITRRVLEEGGFAVVTARSLGELEEVMVQSPPDLLLVDVNMPEMYGDDVVMVLKAVRKVAIPMWLYSNRDQRDLADRAARTGADGYITKSRGAETVLERVREILSERS